MEAKVKKAAPLIVIISVLVYVYPEKFYSLFVFLAGVVVTLVLQALIYYFYLMKESINDHQNLPLKRIFPINETLSERVTIRREDDCSPSSRFERRGTAIPCLCTGPEFLSLASGTDVVISELTQNMKELVQIEKNYGSILSKLGQASFINKVISKKTNDLFGNLQETLNTIGQSHIQEAKNLSESLLENLGLIEKEMKIKHKEIALKLKMAHENVENAVISLQKTQGKLMDTQMAQQKLMSEMEDPKNAGFESLIKKEMKLKVIQSELSTLNHTMQLMKDKLDHESYLYLPKAKEIIEEYKLLKQQKSDQYRSCLQS